MSAPENERVASHGHPKEHPRIQVTTRLLATQPRTATWRDLGDLAFGLALAAVVAGLLVLAVVKLLEAVLP